MDYNAIRKQEKIRRKGGFTAGKDIKPIKRTDPPRTGVIITVCVMSAAAVVLGVWLMLVKGIANVPPGDASATAAPKGAEIVLPTVEPPDTYVLQ